MSTNDDIPPFVGQNIYRRLHFGQMGFSVALTGPDGGMIERRPGGAGAGGRRARSAGRGMRPECGRSGRYLRDRPGGREASAAVAGNRCHREARLPWPPGDGRGDRVRVRACHGWRGTPPVSKSSAGSRVMPIRRSWTRGRGWRCSPERPRRRDGVFCPDAGAEWGPAPASVAIAGCGVAVPASAWRRRSHRSVRR